MDGELENANALDRESLLRASAVFASDRPVAIVTEGLLPYLNREEKTALANNIHEILSGYAGVWITSDVHSMQYREATCEVWREQVLRIPKSQVFSDSETSSDESSRSQPKQGSLHK
jgi:O-methyltransferase involved in polyketide biosynthesis